MACVGSMLVQGLSTMVVSIYGQVALYLKCLFFDVDDKVLKEVKVIRNLNYGREAANFFH